MADQRDYFIERIGWQKGPWDDEPDIVVDTYATRVGDVQLLLHRLPFGAWAALVGIDPKMKDRLLKFRSEMDPKARDLQIVEFDEKSRNAERFDISKIYAGYFYIAPDDLSPAHAKDLANLPDEARAVLNLRYVTMDQAKLDLLDLCDHLLLEGII